MNPKLEGVIFSKNGNLVYRGYYWEEDIFDKRSGRKSGRWYCCNLEDYPGINTATHSRDDLLKETHEILESFIEDAIKKEGYVFLPKGTLRRKRAWGFIEFELSPELTDRVFDYLESGGRYEYACDTRETYQ